MFVFFKNYRDAKSATFISAIGGAFAAGGTIGIISAFSQQDPKLAVFGVILGAIGFLLGKLAEKQAVRVWKKKGIESYNNNA